MCWREGAAGLSERIMLVQTTKKQIGLAVYCPLVKFVNICVDRQYTGLICHTYHYDASQQFLEEIILAHFVPHLNYL
ncbi:hypothetical protein NIES2101_25505 [Calothrix sp. HK-06]|nr:hypothetical protein NIES2101_25505 [Calothrix sp. HK-06]